MNGLAPLILRRLGLSMLSLLLVSAAVFAISSVLPGDAATEALGQNATPEAVATLRAQMGLDDPAPLRYLRWLWGALHGDLGRSMINDRPVAEIIGARLPRSLALASLTAAVSIPLALAMGVASAIRRGGRLDRGVSLLAVATAATPEFLTATLGVLLFAVQLRWLPSLALVPPHPTLLELLRAYALPVITLSLVVQAQMTRMTRAALIEQLDQPYAEMAALKGGSPAMVVLRHALPNAAGPMASAAALSLSYLLGGVIVVETVFDYPGLASLMVDAVTGRDMPLLQACAMIFCTAYQVLALTADIVAILANPRLRRS